MADDIVTRQIKQLAPLADIPVGAEVAVQGDSGPAGRLPLDQLVDPTIRPELAAGNGSDIGYKQTGVDAVQRTVKSKLDDWFHIRDVGDVGTPNDDAVFLKACNRALAENRICDLGSGEINLTSRQTITFPNPAVGPDATNFFARLRLYGEATINSPVGALKLVGSSQQHTIDFQGMVFASGSTGGGKAIEMDCSAYPFFAERTGPSRILAHFRGDDGVTNVNYWSKCVEAIDWSNIDFSGSTFDGASTPAGIAIETRASAGQYVTVFDMARCRFRFLENAYICGTGSQTVRLPHCLFALNQLDIWVPPGGANRQGLSITDFEVFELSTGSFILVESAAPNLVLDSGRCAVGAGYTAIDIRVTDQTNLNNIQFFPDSLPNTGDSAIDIDGTVAGSHCKISNMNFASTTVGARLLSGSKNVHFDESNTGTVGMTLVSDAGSDGSNVIGSQASTPAAKMGYGPGSGDTYVQSTSKATAVDATTPSGRVTTDAASLAAGASVSFTLNNPAFKAHDVVVPQWGNTNYFIEIFGVGDGSREVRITNKTAGPLADAVPFNYVTLAGSGA